MSTASKYSKLKRHKRRLTDYVKRYKLLQSGRPRLVIRRTNRQIIMQLVEYCLAGDRIINTWLSSKLVGPRKNYQSLRRLYDHANTEIKREYADYIIDSGLSNHSENLKKLFDHARVRA